MIQNIDFRGFRKDGEGWIYGDLVHQAFDGTSKILDISIKKPNTIPIEVYKDSVGIFTTASDILNQKIYQHDIVIKEYLDNVLYLVKWNIEHTSFMMECYIDGEVYESRSIIRIDSDIKIIGNLTEHRYLLNQRII